MSEVIRGLRGNPGKLYEMGARGEAEAEKTANRLDENLKTLKKVDPIELIAFTDSDYEGTAYSFHRALDPTAT